MSTDTALLIIIALLVLILIGVLLQVRWTSVWTRAMKEIVAERINKPNADLHALLKKREYSKVVSMVSEKRKIDSDDPALDWYEGLALFHLQDWNESRVVIERAIESNPSYEKDLMPYLNRIKKMQNGCA